jgi:pimeloyl-ACP methyl ester carboxylesterase
MIGIVLLGVLAVLVVGVAAALGYRKLLQRQAAKALVIDTPNGVVEERYVRIGGIDQWIQIRGQDRDNPVLLVLHGGPGSPYAIFTPLLHAWEKHFTVVQWDRRGAGKTFSRNGKASAGEMTFERMLEDAIEVIEFLLAHLRKDKVILMAGSMGTLIGVPLAQRRPDLFSAYVGTDNIVNMLRNESVSYQMTLDRVRAASNTKAVAALEKIGADPARWDLRAWEIKMRWAMATDPVTPGIETKLIFPLVLTSPSYSLRDVISFGRGFMYSKQELYKQWMAYDARAHGTKFELPVFLFQGDNDVLTLTGLAEEYLAEVEAPVKGLALIENASHFVAFTRSEPFLAELLTRVRPLAIAP